MLHPGEMSLLEIKPNGVVAITTITGYQDWCIAPNKQKLVVGDWNGDEFTDLLCHSQNGQMKVFTNQAGIGFSIQKYNY